MSAMAQDTKRVCRIQIGYLLKKTCISFTDEELIKFVPSYVEVTHRRLKKIRKQMRRENRKQLNEKDKNDDEDSESPCSIDDILADSDSDLPEEDGRLIISDKAVPGGDVSGSTSDDTDDDGDAGTTIKKAPKRGMDVDYSDVMAL
ncbi:RRP12-like protein [Eurosta solidaginis]|uniref:RRP12-like protein n=1 Tax=Eurosta solidaginis TaxID=178769 RepID=UPI00353088E2